MNVYTNGDDWFVAESPEDADACAREYWVEDYDGTPADWKKVNPECEFRIQDENYLNHHETHTFREWAIINGRGFLASVNY